MITLLIRYEEFNVDSKAQRCDQLNLAHVGEIKYNKKPSCR